MIRKLSLITFCALLPSLALAQGRAEWDSEKKPGLKYKVHCHKKDVTRCVLQLRPGEKAPFGGILQSPKQQALLTVRADPERIQERIDAAVERVEKDAQNDLDLEKKYRQIDNDAWADKLKKTEENYDERIKRLEDALPSWYEEPWFVTIVSVGATLGVVAGTVAIACKLSGCGQSK